MPPSDYLDVAVRAARRAGALLMRHYGKLRSHQIHTKSRNDFVTELDKRSEALIAGCVLRAFRDHSILGEEGGRSRQGGGALWIIDPLDGTANYIHQFPQFSVSIGVMEKGLIRAGVIYDPLHRELFTAVRGRGAFLNGRRIRASRTKLLGDALMTTGIPFRARNRFDEYLRSFGRVSLATAGMRRGGSAALDLAYVACGRLDGFWELDLSPWDIAAGSLILQEAGGRISDMWGRPRHLHNGDVLASNGPLHAQLLRITRPIFSANPKAPKL